MPFEGAVMFVFTKTTCIFLEEEFYFNFVGHKLFMHIYLRFYVPLTNISLTWRRHHCRWRAAKCRPTFGAQGLWAGRDLYRATPTVTPGLCFSGLIRRSAPFNRRLRHTRGCGASILTRILTGKDFTDMPPRVEWKCNRMKTREFRRCINRYKSNIIC
jgi:hypothetical protein